MRVDKRKEFLLISLMALSSLAVGFHRLDYESLWVDEVGSVMTASKGMNGILDDVSLGGISEGNLPLYFVLLHHVLFLGSSEAVIRGMSVVFGSLSTILLYFVGKILYSQKTAVLSCLLLLLSPFFVYYMQEARMYSLLTFLVLTMTFSSLKYAENGNLKWLFLFAMSSTAVLYTHYFGALPVISLSVGLYLFKGTEKAKPVLIVSLLSIMLLVPWLPIAFNSLSANPKGLPWLEGENSLIKTALSFSGAHYPYGLRERAASVLSILISAFGIFVSMNNKDKAFLVSLPVLLIPVSIVYFISFWASFYHVRYFLFGLPFFCLLLSSGTLRLMEKTKKDWKPLVYLVFSFILISNILSLHESYYTKDKQDYRLASQMISESGKEGDAIIVEPYGRTAALSYYLRNASVGLTLGNYSVFSKEEGKIDVLSLPGHVPEKEWVCEKYERIWSITAPSVYRPQFKEWLDGRRVIHNVSSGGLEVILYGC